MRKGVALRKSIDAKRDFACGRYLLREIFREFSFSLSFSFSSDFTTNRITQEFYRNPATPSPVDPSADIIITLTVLHGEEEREREEELVQLGPRQSSDGSCPTDAAFGKMKRKRRRGRHEERERWRLDQYKDPPDGSTRFFLLCMCVYVCVAFYPSRHFLPTVYSLLPFFLSSSLRLLFLLP